MEFGGAREASEGFWSLLENAPTERRPSMRSTSAAQSSAERPAAKAGDFVIGEDLRVHRLGFGAMRITGKGIWGEPKQRGGAIAALRRAAEVETNLAHTPHAVGPPRREIRISE